jgi:putative PIN family toxin of toxin-antitoxin system
VTPRVVLDSNVVLSALLFSSGRLSWLRTAWTQRRVVPLASRATLDELIRVLSYPTFRLSAADITAILSDYVPFVETVTVADQGPVRASAPDPDDQRFLDLALVGRASFLVTGDPALLTAVPPEGTRVVSPAWLRGALGVGEFS